MKNRNYLWLITKRWLFKWFQRRYNSSTKRICFISMGIVRRLCCIDFLFVYCPYQCKNTLFACSKWWVLWNKVSNRRNNHGAVLRALLFQRKFKHVSGIEKSTFSPILNILINIFSRASISDGQDNVSSLTPLLYCS